MPVEDLEWALTQQRSTKLRKERLRFRKYYDGRHPLAYSTKRYDTTFYKRFEKLADNLCPAVVDSVADRLRVTGFSSTAARRKTVKSLLRRRDVVEDKPAAGAWQIWRRNRMGQRASEVHREALKVGDAYVTVWPDANGNAAIWPQQTDEIVVEYSEEVPGQLARAARVWVQRDGRLRVTVYFPDRLERWIGPERPPTFRNYEVTSAIRELTVSALQPLDPFGTVENPWGRVPVFHFANKTLWQPGVSELKDVPPLQDALNKAVADMLVAMEFSAYRQRWATGVEGEFDENTKTLRLKYDLGADTILGEEDPAAKFGTFDSSDLRQFIEVHENLRAQIARVSGTPLHYLFITRGDFPSGEAMKSAEARFSTKLEDKQGSFGDTWEDALLFGLAIEGARVAKGTTLDALWTPSTPRSEEETMRTLLMKKQLGISRRQLLREAGYNEEQINQILDELDLESEPEPTTPPDEDAPIGDDDA